MDQAEKTMMDNLFKNTGKDLEEWKKIALTSGFEKHGELVNFLKTVHRLGHGYANFIVHKAKSSDAGSADDKSELIDNQYKGKENLRPYYETLMAGILKIGGDIEVAPKNASVSLRRKKQFCLLEPKTKTRLEVGLNMKGVEPQGILESYGSNTMCSHKIRVESAADITPEVFAWIKKAYEQAG
jgi:predicted transport protein